MLSAIGPVELEAAEQAAVKLRTETPKRWRKWRDAPLADNVIYKLRRRARLGMTSPADAEAQVDHIRRRIRSGSWSNHDLPRHR